MSDETTREIANHVLHFFHSDEGYAPGSFFSTFYVLLARADQTNINRLSEAYPIQVNAFLMARKSQEGMDYLREIAKPKLHIA